MTMFLDSKHEHEHGTWDGISHYTTSDLQCIEHLREPKETLNI